MEGAPNGSDVRRSIHRHDRDDACISDRYISSFFLLWSSQNSSEVAIRRRPGRKEKLFSPTSLFYVASGPFAALPRWGAELRSLPSGLRPISLDDLEGNLSGYRHEGFSIFGFDVSAREIFVRFSPPMHHSKWAWPPGPGTYIYMGLSSG